MGEKQSGLLLIDKPKGPTSHDIIDRVREITGIEKVGHTGTLDPQAEGLLLVLVGRSATKQQSDFLNLDKEYQAKIKLGEETDTLDAQGEVTSIYDGEWPSINKLKSVLEQFKGTYHQVPPAYSAKKLKGERAYKLARKGEKPELEPERVEIYELELVDYSPPKIEIRVKCSKGTYIRALARDVGKKLGCGAHLAFLKRTQIGSYNIKQTAPISNLNSENWDQHLKSI